MDARVLCLSPIRGTPNFLHHGTTLFPGVPLIDKGGVSIRCMSILRADRIQEQMALLTAERHRLRNEGHRKIAESKGGDEMLSDQAVEIFKRADALDGRVN